MATATTESSLVSSSDEESGPQCGPDCWLKQEAPTPLELGAYIPSTTTGSTSPEQHLHPSEAAKHLYSPLRPWQTRLIRLNPGTPAETLQCSLLTADIIASEGLGVPDYNEVIEYEALSYHWGEPAFTHPLRCGETVLGVTMNLASALLNLRLADRPRYLWVDALCINQHDNQEKASQVQNMFIIYRKAKVVIAWLGPQLQWTHLAFDLLSVFSSDSWYYLPGHDLSCLDRLRRAYEALREIFERVWFRRTWIRQEVFTARNLVLQCGKLVRDWKIIPSMSHIEDQLYGVEETLTNAEIAFTRFERSKLRVVNITKDPLRVDMNINRWWLRFSAGQGSAIWLGPAVDGSLFDVTDDRDRVYAYVGMANELLNLVKDGFRSDDSKTPAANARTCGDENTFSQVPFPVDYAKSVSVLYQDVIKRLINQHRRLGALQVCQSRKNLNPDFPSWVIDFGQRTPRSLTISTGIPSYNAQLQDLRQTNRLVLNGRCVGTVKHDTSTVDVAPFHHKMQWWDHSSQLMPPFFYFGDYKNYEEFKDSGAYKCASVWVQEGVLSSYSKRKQPLNEFTMALPNDDGLAWSPQTLSARRPLAFVADTTECGDLLVVFQGSDCIFVLRKVLRNDQSYEYTFLGPAFLWERSLDFVALASSASSIEEFVIV